MSVTWNDSSPIYRQLKERGYLAMGGQIVDATLVAAPKQRNTGHAQPRNQRGGFAMAMREAHAQALALGAAAMAAGHVGRGPGLVDEDQALGIEIELAVEPVVPLLQDVGAVLLDRMPSLFLRVMP